jgi:hypothetical protein
MIAIGGGTSGKTHTEMTTATASAERTSAETNMTTTTANGDTRSVRIGTDAIAPAALKTIDETRSATVIVAGAETRRKTEIAETGVEIPMTDGSAGGRRSTTMMTVETIGRGDTRMKSTSGTSEVVRWDVGIRGGIKNERAFASAWTGVHIDMIPHEPPKKGLVQTPMDEVLSSNMNNRPLHGLVPTPRTPRYA